MPKAKTVEPVVVREIQKNSIEVYRVCLVHFMGKQYVDLRVWFLAGSQWKPGKAGVMVRPDQAEELVGALVEAAGRCERGAG